MDRNTIIGMLLLFGLFYTWSVINAPTDEELAEQKRKDSLELIQNQAPVFKDSNKTLVSEVALDSTINDSIRTEMIEEQTFTLENEVATYTFSSKGGKIVKAHLKNFSDIDAGTKDEDLKKPLYLLNDARNAMEIIFPSNSGTINTRNLDFTSNQKGNTLTFTALLPQGGSIQQVYTLRSDYVIDYLIKLSDINSLSSGSTVSLNWIDYLPALEKNSSYEKYYTTQYYKESGDSPTYLSSQSASSEAIKEKIQWVSHSNQFFNSTLIAQDGFDGASLEVAPMENDSSLLFSQSQMNLRVDNPSEQTFKLTYYIGPNDFEHLKDLGYETSDIIPFGWSIFGTINRWVIRPAFNFLLSLPFISSKGVVIIVLTFLIKLALFPLTYKMLKSQTMMAGLKDRIKALRDKHKDDSQAQQMETMKLYREYGVSPLGGCLPMVLQMPIWFALYRFFPASIEFRQAPFLWATDLSSYDVFWHLPFNIPFYGSHVSLFTLLWAVSLFIYTLYNMKNLDMSQTAGMGNSMKYFQLAMPVMFLFFLNSYASGLTCYLLFSNLINIIQTVVTKNVIFNDDKIQAKLNQNKAKPKKRGKFQQRLENIMKEQQRIQQDKNKKK